MSELPKTYDPKSVEDKLYKFWVDSRLLPCRGRSGQETVYHRYSASECYRPAAHGPRARRDPAGHPDPLLSACRATRRSGCRAPTTPVSPPQIKVEENLRKEEGLTRYDLGREEFFERVWAWKHKYGDRIIEPAEEARLAPATGTRERFTMDEGCSKAVREVFVNLYEKGLIYQGNRIINWCPHCTTALSDAEVEYAEQAGQSLAHPLSAGGRLRAMSIVATTRPETLLGDTGVAVNPNDERYKHLIGKTLHPAACGPRDPGRRRRVRRHGVRHRLRQDHAGARPERL